MGGRGDGAAGGAARDLAGGGDVEGDAAEGVETEEVGWAVVEGAREGGGLVAVGLGMAAGDVAEGWVAACSGRHTCLPCTCRDPCTRRWNISGRLGTDLDMGPLLGSTQTRRDRR